MWRGHVFAHLVPWSFTEGCAGCGFLRTGCGRQQANNETCRTNIEGLICETHTPSGASRFAAVDHRINRALSHAVERRAVKDPGKRGKLIDTR